MWGAQNQPGNNGTAWPSGYGYVPSAAQSATYTSGSPPTLNSVSLTATGSVTSIATGASVQMNAACHYNNGTTTNCNTADAYGNSVSSWNTSNAGVATISGSGLATGVSIGSTNLTAVAAGVTSAAFALAVTAPPMTLSSVTLATTGGVTSIVAGTTNQLIATCHYSNSSTTTCTTADSYGNAVSSWTSSATAIATVSSGGLVTGVAAGSTNLMAVAAGITSSPALTLSVTAAPPTLQGGYLGTPGGANTMTVGGTLQFSAYCQYSNSTTTNCSVADIYGNAVTQWLSSNTSEVTVGAVGSANPGLATAVAAGSPNIQAYVGSVHLNEWVLYISNPPVSLTGVSLATTGGATALFVGFTNQLVATCTYSDGSTTNCTTTDSHGNVAGNYSSSSTSHATVGASTGLVTGVAAGTTNLTAQAGSFTSSPLPLNVIAMPSGTYTITITGPVAFSGTVYF
jgi:trimeric autotransporter adhesin